MSEENQTGKPGVGWDPTTIMAVLTLLGGLFLAQQHLTSDRPIAEPGAGNVELTEQKFDTRLWEDPFAALTASVDTNGFGDLPADLAFRNTNGVCQAIEVLPIMVPVGPSSEDRETRTRIRYAVISALTEAGYDPDRPEQIGIWGVRPWPSKLNFGKGEGVAKANATTINLAWQAGDLSLELRWPGLAAGDRGAEPLPVPFEWYEQSAGSPGAINVLVLWLDEDAFIDKPYRRLDSLIVSLLHSATNCAAVSVATVGPVYSSTLKALLQDVNNQPPTNSTLSRSKLFLATPRAREKDLLPFYTNGPYVWPISSRSNMVSFLVNKRAFTNVTDLAVSDDTLAGEAICELTNRGINLHDPKDHLVLITDEDIFGSRKLRDVYEARMSGGKRLAAGQTVSNIDVFHYLRGLDGQQLASSKRIADTNPDQIAANDLRKKDRTWKFDVNKAEGPNQLDYLDRLALTIESLSHGFTSRHEGKVKAIGIAGGDVYDTLLILQAIRPHFPDAVFFTMDLDARLWTPKEWEWTHNLLVFSGYGLRLNKALQEKIGVFRDSRQTAIYAATLAALNYHAMTQVLGGTSGPRSGLVPPCRFEIGRNGPLDLSDATNGPAIHPGRHETDDHGCWIVLKVSVGMVCVGGLCVFLSQFARELTIEETQYLAEPLWLREEDLGGFLGMWRVEKSHELLFCFNRGLFCDGTTSSSGGIVPWTTELKPVDGGGLDRLLVKRGALDKELETLKSSDPGGSPGEALCSAELLLASDAREGAWHLFFLRRFRLRMYQCVVVPLLVAFLGIGLWWAAVQTKVENGGILGATSARPTVWLCILTFVLALVFLMESHLQLRATAVHTSRLFRLRFFSGKTTTGAIETPYWRLWGSFKKMALFLRRLRHRKRECVVVSLLVAFLGLDCLFVATSAVRTLFWCALAILFVTYRRLLGSSLAMFGRASRPSVPPPVGFVDADEVWTLYQKKTQLRYRVFRALILSFAYCGSVVFLLKYLGEDISSTPTLRTEGLRHAYVGCIFATVAAFLLLAFWTVDAAYLCRWFIQTLADGPTRYSEATLKYFSELRGRVDRDALAEFIDVRIIAEITDRVGTMLYFPAVILLLIILSHNTVTFVWPWRGSWVAVIFCHFVVALLSVVVLQNAAKRARDASVASLEAKLQRARAAQAVTDREKAGSDVDDGEKLLAEMRSLRSGAFAGFAGNPVVGAILVPSGGAVLMEIVRHFLEN